ncbi:N-acetylmuramoyl-L-alanine amidase [Pendulispora albinea]|uniref:N-acetylmuramoyl-L-alanine amidase n=1 Tax=Pendulispora albinea TaxID=2741071 RepID=A0ABZ2M1F0_9BACT
MKRIFAGCMILVNLGVFASCQTAPPESGELGPTGPEGTRQRAFAEASREFGVPESVLLGVAYMESRWDANAGAPSRSAGYGPMHLTDVDAARSMSSRAQGQMDEDDADPRGDDARPLRPSATRAVAAEMAPSLRTMDLAARLVGLDRDTLRRDPEQNIRAGAALLAHYQRAANPGALSADPADWYGAVARYSGAADAGSAKRFADDVFETMAEGAHRVTDDGQDVTLFGRAELRPRKVEQLERLGLRASVAAETDCPAELGCEWIPAPYQELGGGDYGNHDLADRPNSQRISYIIVHDTEGYYPHVLEQVQDPTYVSWHYTLRSSDGHVAQHVRTKDVAWHAGNWYVNAKSIGLEHEGFAAQGTWYTEALYRSSARLVRYLALRYGIPLDRAHILGHDNVQGTVPNTVKNMHWDPGPYWDWAHYFDLLGAPLRKTGGARAGLVTIKPDFAKNQPPFIGCDKNRPADPCPARPSSAVILRTEPRADAPLLKDVGRHPPDGTSTLHVSDHGSRVSTGQQYAVAERRGDWTAIWYLGQKGWFYNPPSAPAALPAFGFVVTPKEGKASIPVYGRAYPEKEAYPAQVPVQAIVPLQYALLAGQRYAVGEVPEAEYLWATTFDPAGHVVVEGGTRYFQVQFGHRVAYVMADDVQLLPSGVGAP